MTHTEDLEMLWTTLAAIAEMDHRATTEDYERTSAAMETLRPLTGLERDKLWAKCCRRSPSTTWMQLEDAR